MSEQNKKLLQVGLALFVILIGGAFYYWYIAVRGTEKDEAKLQAALEREITDLKRELSRYEEMGEMRQRVAAMRAKLERVSERLPSSKDAEGFLANLSDMLSRSSVNVQLIQSIRPQEESNYTEIPWGITADAQYFEFGMFLTMVEQNPRRLMRVKQFEINNNPDLPGLHPVDVQISTFMFNQ